MADDVADDVVLCVKDKDVLELELEQCGEALEKRGTKVSRAKTEYMCLNGTPLARDQEYVGRNTMEMVPPGRRKRGRPKQRWMDCVNRDMRAIGTTSDEVHDRNGWRRIVSAAATPQPSGSG